MQTVANRLQSAESRPEGEHGHGQQQPTVDPKKSIREKSVICMECCKSMKLLPKKHLATHGLTPQQYKEKWGFKKNQPLVAKSLSRQRRKKMQEIQLWKKRKNA
jgi:predicted transcriptional regulator